MRVYRLIAMELEERAFTLPILKNQYLAEVEQGILV